MRDRIAAWVRVLEILHLAAWLAAGLSELLHRAVAAVI